MNIIYPRGGARGTFVRNCSIPRSLANQKNNIVILENTNANNIVEKKKQHRNTSENGECMQKPKKKMTILWNETEKKECQGFFVFSLRIEIYIFVFDDVLC